MTFQEIYLIFLLICIAKKFVGDAINFRRIGKS